MIKYLLLIVLAYLWWDTLFKRNKNYIKGIAKKSRKLHGITKTFDKREIEQQLIRSKKIISNFKKFRLIKPTFEDDIEDGLSTLGIMRKDEYLSKIFNTNWTKTKQWSVILAGVLILNFLLFLLLGADNILRSVLLFLTVSFPSFMIIVALYQMVFIPADIKIKVKNHVKAVEKDYYLLFDHFFYYYGYDNNQRKTLSMIVAKFTYDVSDDMQTLIETLQDDCKISEQQALTNMQRRYNSSLKLSELAAKLMACVNNKALAKDNLNALKEQIKTERSIQESMEDERTLTKFITVMAVAMLIILFSSAIGTLTQLM